MIGFFIKKAFYDGWDNLLALMSVNIAMLAVGFGGFFLAGFASPILPLSIAIAVAAVLAEGVLITACRECEDRE